MICACLVQAMASGQVHKRDRVGLGLGWLEQAVEAAMGSWKGSDSGLSSTTENLILLALFGALSLVLWRRRTLRAAQAAQQWPPGVRLRSRVMPCSFSGDCLAVIVCSVCHHDDPKNEACARSSLPRCECSFSIAIVAAMHRDLGVALRHLVPLWVMLC